MRRNDDEPPGYDPEFEAHMERVRKESARLRLDWYTAEAVLERNERETNED
jgi:hypothetical protein